MKKNYVVPSMKVNEIRNTPLLAASLDPYQNFDPYQDPNGQQIGGESSGMDY